MLPFAWQVFFFVVVVALFRFCTIPGVIVTQLLFPSLVVVTLPTSFPAQCETTLFLFNRWANISGLGFTLAGCVDLQHSCLFHLWEAANDRLSWPEPAAGGLSKSWKTQSRRPVVGSVGLTHFSFSAADTCTQTHIMSPSLSVTASSELLIKFCGVVVKDEKATLKSWHCVKLDSATSCELFRAKKKVCSVFCFFSSPLSHAGCDTDWCERSREEFRQSVRPGTIPHHPACQPHCHSHSSWERWAQRTGRLGETLDVLSATRRQPEQLWSGSIGGSFHVSMDYSIGKQQ